MPRGNPVNKKLSVRCTGHKLNGFPRFARNDEESKRNTHETDIDWNIGGDDGDAGICGRPRTG